MKTKMALVGCGLMGQSHLRRIIDNFPDTDVEVICEPVRTSYDAGASMLKNSGRPVPLYETTFNSFIKNHRGRLDAAFIVTPHVLHHEQATACLEAGMDVLLEKPMVMTVGEAESLIATRNRTGKHLVVAFQGSLSPNIRAAVSLLQNGNTGPILSISGTIWQSWDRLNANSWRQRSKDSGGGFLFDTGAHLLNTICELAGEPFVEVAAWLDNCHRAVDLRGAIIGRLRSGALVTINACGDTSPSCASEILVFCKSAILRTGAWGRFLDIQYEEARGWEAVDVPTSQGVWGEFLAIRAGETENTSPAEAGLRMIHLWEAIQASSMGNGAPVRIGAQMGARN